MPLEMVKSCPSVRSACQLRKLTEETRFTDNRITAASARPPQAKAERLSEAQACAVRFHASVASERTVSRTLCMASSP